MTHPIDRIKSLTIDLQYGENKGFCGPNPFYESGCFSEGGSDIPYHARHIPRRKKIVLHVYAWLLRRIHSLFPRLKLSMEQSFRNVLIHLFAHRTIRSCLIGTHERQKMFYQTLSNFGVVFEPRESLEHLLHYMTGMDYEHYLAVHASEHYLDSLLIPQAQKTSLLCGILQAVERLPILSRLKIQDQREWYVVMETIFARYRVIAFDIHTGSIQYTQEDNKITSPLSYYLPHAKNCISNQRKIIASIEGPSEVLAYGCGEIMTVYQGLEQLLYMEGIRLEKVALYKTTDLPEAHKDYLFVSLYNITDCEKIVNQMKVIDFLDTSVLNINNHEHTLNTLYFNISFETTGTRFPSGIHALYNDIQDKNLILLLDRTSKQWNFECCELAQLAKELREAQQRKNKEPIIRDIIDRFRQFVPLLLEKCSQEKSVYTHAMEVFLQRELLQHLKPIEVLIYLDLMLNNGITCSLNCSNSLDYTLSALSVKKAAYAYFHITQSPFIPLKASIADKTLFKGLYTMYLKWEEPEISFYLTLGNTQGSQSFSKLVKKSQDFQYILF